MKLPICTDGLPVPVSQELINVLSQEAEKHHLTDRDLLAIEALTFNFRDPDYSPEHGGYHPVEIRLSRVKAGFTIDYLTDFAYVGVGWMSELAKELDFDIQQGVFEGSERVPIPIADAVPVYEMFEVNFLSYHRMGVFEVEIHPERR